MLAWIEIKDFWVGLPCFYNELIRGEPFEGFKSLGKVISIYKSFKVGFELGMSLIIIALYSGFLEGSIHTLNLAICPGMVNLRKAMGDVMFMAHTVKNVPPGMTIHGSVCKLNTVVGEDGMDLIRHNLDKVS